MSKDRRRSGSQPAEAPDFLERLVPGGGQALYGDLSDGPGGDESRHRRYLYSLVSSIRVAIRDRADDQKRSTERSDTPSASAVSAVVRPAK